VTDRQREGCHGDGRSRRYLRRSRRAELASDKTAEQHIAASRQRREDPERPEMAADQRIPAGCKIGHQHRIVRCGELQVPTRHDEVELLPEIAVAISDQQES
jgi:hypothetical protein